MINPNPPSPQLLESITELWGLTIQPVGCQKCGQVYLVYPSMIGARCPSCALGIIESQPAYIRLEPPEMIIPFQIKNGSSLDKSSTLYKILTQFTKGVWLHMDDFNPISLYERIVSVFMPMWLFDCTIIGSWQADTGYDYQVKSSCESFSNGQWRTQDIVETRIRWEPRLGQLNRTYNNLVVPALSDQQKLRNIVGDFYFNESSTYKGNLLSNAIVRLPDLSPENSFSLAQSEIIKITTNECRQAAKAQQIRNYSIKAGFENINWTQMLIPYYTTYYFDDNGNPVMILINGQTGKIGGLRIVSQKKGWLWAGISAGIAIILFLFALVCFALTSSIPIIAGIGLIFIIISMVFGIFTILPVAYPWYWNRKQIDRKIH